MDINDPILNDVAQAASILPAPLTMCTFLEASVVYERQHGARATRVYVAPNIEAAICNATPMFPAEWIGTHRLGHVIGLEWFGGRPDLGPNEFELAHE